MSSFWRPLADSPGRPLDRIAIFVVQSSREEAALTKGFGFGDIFKIQEKVQQVQKELAGKRVEASSGGGMVRVVASGSQEILEIHIDPEVVNPEEIEMMEDLVMAAVNEARERSKELMIEEVSKLTGGLRIPGLF
jgi:DNA-binding YbaB/EbfC family protein